MQDRKIFTTKILSIAVSFALLIPIVTVSTLNSRSVDEYADTLQETQNTVISERTTEEYSEPQTEIEETTTTQEGVTEAQTEPETTEEVEEVDVYEDIQRETVAAKQVPTTVNSFYNEDDLYILSHLIYGEAGGESDECQLAVGSVVLNRVKSKSFPKTNTISEVVFADGQYACTWDGNYDKEPDARAISNARYLLEHGSQLPDGVVYQAQFVQGEIYAVIDGEYFCYG